MDGHTTTTHPGQLSLLLSVGLEMSTGQIAVMLWGWGVKAGWLIPFVNKRVGGRYNCVILSTFEVSIATHYKALYNCPVYAIRNRK